MFILKKGHQPGVYVPLRALFLVYHEVLLASMFTNLHNSEHLKYFIPQYSPLFQNKA